MAVILGWDIGGVNTKAVRLDDDGVLRARSRPFELQRDPGGLVGVLAGVAGDLGASATERFTCAVTMTAELSQMFRTKRDGVAFVLDAVSTAFPAAEIRVFATNGRFLPVEQARADPLSVAAANWAATARLVAERFSTSLLIDMGTTTTDIIPIVDGLVVSNGMTDPERLASGELVYTGALRTPVEAIVREVPYRSGRAAVSAEGFALVGDAHLWRGCLAAEDYTVAAPDGRAATREFAGERLARVVCADRELLDEPAIGRIADAIAAQQMAMMAAAIRRVRARHASICTAVVTGLGEFIARDAAQAEGLEVVSLGGELGPDASRYAPAAAVALLVRGFRRQAEEKALPADHLRQGSGGQEAGSHESSLLVIKVGGGLLAHADHLDRVLTSIADVARTRRVLVVPGGGPFADVVRDVDGRLGIGHDAAHWMAILGMDQYAHLLASRLAGGHVVSNRLEIESAHRDGTTPVLALSRWLAAADPLPHTWEVTSDSIAAWVAGQVQASRLLLVKPPGARGSRLVDGHFEHALPPGVVCDCLAADDAIDLLCQQAALMARSI